MADIIVSEGQNMDIQKRNKLIEMAEKLESSALERALETMPKKKYLHYSDGELMKEIRIYIDFPQKEIAQKMGISAPALSGHEKRNEVNLKTLNKFCETIGIEMDTFEMIIDALDLLKTDLNDLMSSPEESLKKIEMITEELKKNSQEIMIKNIEKRLETLSMYSLREVSRYVRLIEIAQEFEKEQDKKPS